MASPFFALPKTALKQTFAENTNLNTFLYCSNNAATLINAAKSLKIQSKMNFKNSKFTHVSSASQPAVRPGSTSATALKFLHNKGSGFTKLLFQRTFIDCAMVLPFILY